MKDIYDTKTNKILMIDTYGDIFDKLLPDDLQIQRQAMGEYYYKEFDSIKIYRIKDNEEFWIAKALPTDILKNLHNLYVDFDFVFTIGSPLFEKA